MLAFDDAGIARLIRAARDVPSRCRKKWLLGIAARLDPAPRTNDASFRRRKAEQVRRHRERQRAGRSLYYVEADSDTFNLMVRLGELHPDTIADRQAVADALGRLLRRGLLALIERKRGVLK